MSKVYEYVQERIIRSLEESIENGNPAPWVKPWNRKGVPKNFITKRPYRGINLLLLESSGYYLTWKQLKKLQEKYPFLKLKNKAKSNMVVFWQFIEAKVEDIDDEKSTDVKSDETASSDGYNCFKYYTVYHESDIEGFDRLVNENDIEENISEFIDADTLIEEYSKVVPMTIIDTNNAYYDYTNDKINIPEKKCFDNIEYFYSVAFHEMIHSTGHQNRNNRPMKDHRFGSKDYSKEELVAEIGAAMLCAEFNIENPYMERTTNSYLYNWLSVIKKDIRLVTYAAQQAQKACDYIINTTNIHSVLSPI